MRPLASGLPLAPGLALLAGCSSLLGLNDVTLGDGGVTTAPPNTVVGRSYHNCTSLDGKMTVQPTDESANTIAALIADATQPTGFRVINGVGKADGTFEVDNVPDGVEFMLRLGRSYFVTSAHTLDNHDNEPQRCDPPFVPASPGTIMHLQVANMTPFTNGPNNSFDSIEVDSFNLLYQGFRSDVINTSTALAMDFQWSTDGSQLTGVPVPLLNATAGDDLLITHQHGDHLAGPTKRDHFFTHVADTFQPTGVTLQDAATTNVTGSFVAAGNPKSTTMFVTRGQFDAGFDGTTAFQDLQVSYLVDPIANDFGVGATLASIDFSDWTRSAVRSESLTATYADPFPAAWSRTVVVSYLRSRQIKLPGTAARPVQSFGEHAFTLTGGTPTLTPTLPTVTNIKVGGLDFGGGGLVKFDGVKPVAVSWNGVAAAKYYILIVRRVVANGAQSNVQTVGSFSTAGTSVQMPADLLSSGEFFVFLLEAVQAPTDFTTGQLNANGLPFQTTEVPSGLFRFSGTCGNHQIDPGEDCDDGGVDTANCNANCTKPMCGDGYRNAAAGEACDTIIDTESCNGGNCTVPRCGDSYVNTALEDCDDGNAIDDNNGCSADCKFNNVCGNGHVESLLEQCDTGGAATATCNANCTTSRCGDGILNTLAGEQCDDGNNVDGDHCSPTCQID